MFAWRKATLGLTLAVAASSVVLLAPGAVASPGDTERLNVSTAGAQANDFSGSPAVSADGRFVAFSSSATNLVPGVFGESIFLRDRQSGTTTLVSVNNAGNPAFGESFGPAISADGQFVAFVSDASNLVPGDTNFGNDVFVRDLQAGTTERVSVDSAGNDQGPTGSAGRPAISADGRFVAFMSPSTLLAPGDTDILADVFVRDRQSDTTERVSVDNAGDDQGGFSQGNFISADGRFVAFE